MQRIRFAHRRLAILALAALPLALPAALGCGGTNTLAPPQEVVRLNDSTRLAGLSISHGELSPAFDPQREHYRVRLWAETTNFTVTARVSDPNAKLNVGGAYVESGEPVNVAHLLKDGNGVINIVVKSEDGMSTSITRLALDSSRPNTDVFVLDGVGGSPVADAVVTLKDEQGRVLQDNIAVPESGAVRLCLDRSLRYHISAKGRNTARATFAHFDPARETQARLVCMPYFIVGYPAESPVITRVAFRPYRSSSDATPNPWQDVPEGVHALWATRLNTDTIGVWAASLNPISGDMGGEVLNHKPMRVALDRDATSVVGDSSQDLSISNVLEEVAPVHLGGSGEQYWSSGYAFRIATAGAHDGAHFADIAVMDIAGNRTQQRLYLTLTDEQPSVEAATDPDISALKPRFLAAQGHTYGISRNQPAVAPVPGYGATCYNYLNFRLQEGTMVAIAAAISNPWGRIRGFEVYRADVPDPVESDFRLVDTVTYALPYGGVSVIAGANTTGDLLGALLGLAEQRYKYYDTDPRLNENTTYHYKIRAYNFNFSTGSGFTPFTDVLAVRPLPAFAALLAEPAHGSVAKTLWPTFRHRTSLPLLQTAGEYRFMLHANGIHAGQLSVLNFRARILLDAQGRPAPEYVSAESSDGALTWSPAVYQKGTDEDGEPIMAPFITVGADGTISIETDNQVFKQALGVGLAGVALEAGKTYEWSIFGREGGVYNLASTATNAPYFHKSYPLPQGSNAESQDAFSFGSTDQWGLGAPNGTFTLTIDPAAN